MNGTGLTPEQAARLQKDLREAWDNPDDWVISGSIDIKDKGAEIDFEHRDPKEPKQDE